MKKRWFNLFFTRLVLVCILIAIQILCICFMVLKLSKYSIYITWGFSLLSIIAVLYIINRKDNPAYKLVWSIMILLIPIFGGLFYLFFNFQATPRMLNKKIKIMEKKQQDILAQDKRITDEIKLADKNFYNETKYLVKTCSFPVYKNTKTEYLSPGEAKFAKLLCELEKAKHFIFIEYFIIDEGIMWSSVLDILIRKASQGVDVRVLYDDMGCLFLLPGKYPKDLEKKGIKCSAFNKFKPFLSAIQNNRDHRKIVVIDGHTAFTGGINIADEYINVIEKHGHWKDSSIMLYGDAVWSFTVFFLQMWNITRNDNDNYLLYHPDLYKHEEFTDDGYVQPYCDSPLDDENVGENVYLGIINTAADYVYIMTPYLILDSEMINALSLASKSGVDVKIITPKKWDKWFVHMTTRSYYQTLIEAGVEIYEYTPGFIHSKVFVSDNIKATVGTINLDYRSLYLHFECGVMLYKTSSIKDIQTDFIETLNKSEKITIKECKKSGFFVKLAQKILQLFSPLM